MAQQRARTVYTVDMGRTIGYAAAWGFELRDVDALRRARAHGREANVTLCLHTLYGEVA